jgi:predicted transposase/invertase (TIGR01784 family)
MALSKFLDPKNDVAFKKVFGNEKNKDILIHFINDILEFQGNDQVIEVEFLSPIQDPDIAYKKQSIVDVLCKDKNGVQIIVEMQVAPTKGFEKRAQYYASKAYSRQLNSGTEDDGRYENLKEVIFIAIANCVIFPDKLAYKSDHVILDKVTSEHDLQDFSFTFIELPKFKKNDISELHTILEKWCYFFKYAASTSEEDLDKLIGSDLVIKRAYDALTQFNWNEAELLAYEREIKRIRDNRAVLDYQLDKAKAQGKAEGEAIGEARGKAEGKFEAMVLTAKNMLEKGLDIKFISECTNLSIDEIDDIKNKKLIKNQGLKTNN